MQQQIERRSREIIKKEIEACRQKRQSANQLGDRARALELIQEACRLNAELQALDEAQQETKKQQQNQQATEGGKGGKMQGAAATLVQQEAAKAGEVVALNQPEADSAGTTTAEALAALLKRSAPVEYEGKQLKEEEPALKRKGLTPRALGDNARSRGTNPRARGENPRNRRSLTALFREKPKADKVEEIAGAGMRLFNLTDRTSEKKILAKVWTAKGLGISDEFILWQMDNSAEYGRQPLNLFCVRMNRAFDQIKAGINPAALRTK